MRRWLALATFVAVAGAVLYINQRRQQTTHVGPEAVLAVAAEAQHELSRVPARITRLSDADETRIGNDIAERYSYRARAVDENDAQVEHYVSEVGSQVAAHARRKLQYSFHYLPDGNFVNAFALPGGHVFIGKGLMKLMDSEDELASVLGHEIEHVEHYHCNEKAQLEAIQRNLPLGSLVTLPMELFEAGYSKDQELEADRDGTQLAVLAGYSPQGAVHMFEAFAKLERQYVKRAETPDQELSQVAIGSIMGYFRSHPLPEEREQQIRRMIVSQRWPAREERALKVLLA
jgi:predicted Zn-dependent protease